jgi:hypothetical protein
VRLGVLVVAVAGILAASCGATPTPSTHATSTPPAGLPADHVLVAIEAQPESAPYAWVPNPRLVTLTADGTVVRQVGANDATRMPEFRRWRLSPEALAGAWSTITGGGLAHDGDLAVPGVFDRTSTFILVDDGAARTTLRIQALDAGHEGVDGATIPSAQRPVRAAAAALLAALAPPDDAAEWAPDRVVVRWVVSDPGSRAVASWAGGPDLAVAGAATTAAAGFDRCATVSGADAAKVASVLRQLPPEATVTQAGASYVVGGRALLPDETPPPDCPPG